MQDLINSVVRFSAAMTLFSMQQLQNAVGAATDSQGSINKFRDALDSITNAITSQMDDSNKSAANSMSKLGTEMVDRTWDAMNVRALDPREVMQTTGNVMRKTTDSLTDLVKKATASGEKSEKAGEPQSAAEALSGKRK